MLKPTGTEPDAEEWVIEEALKDQQPRAGPTPRPRTSLLALSGGLRPRPRPDLTRGLSAAVPTSRESRMGLVGTCKELTRCQHAQLVTAAQQGWGQQECCPLAHVPESFADKILAGEGSG